MACTDSVWSLIEEHGGPDPGAVVWGICYMSIKGVVKEIGESTRLFKVAIPLDGRTHLLKAVCHGGDAGEPVITIMMPDED